jgi:Icc-related predicted phosphoesterase
VAGVGGTFAPTWFETPVSDLPHTRPSDDKRRHFVRQEVEACKRLREVQILMTHEAARPFILADVGRPGARPRRLDAGKPAINELLATLKPRLHLCGHHHRFVETEREGVRSVCIDRINRSYLLIDTGTWQYEKVDQ